MGLSTPGPHRVIRGMYPSNTFRIVSSLLIMGLIVPAVKAQSSQGQQPGAGVVQISQHDSEALVIKKIPPVYPAVARQARVQGTVLLEAEISQEGSVENLHLISGHPLLAAAAIDAVKQWQYKPYFLNGAAVDVRTQVSVNFTLASDQSLSSAGGPVSRPGNADLTSGDSNHVSTPQPELAGRPQQPPSEFGSLAQEYGSLVQTGRAQLQAGTVDLALASAESAIKMNADRWEGYALAGGALMNLKRYQEAVDNFSKAIDKAPEAKQAALGDLRKQCLDKETAGPAVSNAPAAPTTTTQAEVVLWKSIENSQRQADFQAYLQQYPNGTFAILARNHFQDLQARAAASMSAAQVTKNMELAKSILTNKRVEEMSFAEWQFILSEGTSGDADTVWSTLKSQHVQMIGHVISIEPAGRTTRLRLAVSLDDVHANRADTDLTMATMIPEKYMPNANTDIRFEGRFISYVADGGWRSFVMTMDNGRLVVQQGRR